MQTRFMVLVSAAILVAASIGSYQWAVSDSSGGDGEPIHSNGGSGPAAGPAVTIEEFDAAINAKLDCIEAAGLTVERFPRDGLRPTISVVTAHDSDGEADLDSVRSAQAITGECRSIHFDPISERWNAQLTLPSDSEVAALFDRLAACVEAGGVPSNSHIPTAPFATYRNGPAEGFDVPNDHRMSYYKECALAETAATGLSAPIPLFLLSVEP